MTQVAESGKARYVPVDKLEPGMKVHKDVMGRRGTPLVNAGEILSRSHVTQLKKWEARPAPQGAALPRAKKGDPITHAPFVGGYRPSDFNPKGILVSATLSSGSEEPAVVDDPTKSPLIQGTAGHVFGSPDMGVDSPLFRCRTLEVEIKALESTNAQLGGDLHTTEKKFATEKELTGRRDALAEQNSELIKGMRNAKPSGGTSKKGK
jgi:hypothetical protein